MKLKAIALLLLALSWMAIPGTAAPSPAMLAQLPPIERVPNSTAVSSYPRWLPWLNVEPATNMDTGILGSTMTQTSGIAMDSRNVLHSATTTSANYPLGTAPARLPIGLALNVAYRHSRYDQRNSGGFCTGMLLDTTQANIANNAQPRQLVSNVDIAVDSNDCAHVVWTHTWDAYGANPARAEIYYAKSPVGGWPSNATSFGVISLTPHPDPTQKGLQFSNPRIKVGTDGVARIVCVQEDQTVPLDQYSRPLGNKKLAYITVTNGVPSTPAPISGAWTDGTCWPKIALTAANVPQIVWTATYVDTGTPPLGGHFTQAFYSNGTGGGGAIGGLATITGSSTVAQDVHVDQTGGVHYMYITQPSTQSGYGASLGVDVQGSLTYFSTALGSSLLSTSATGGGVITDSRGQVHTFWKSGGAMYYGARVKNPGPGLNAAWDLQSPALAAPTTTDPKIYALAIAKNDQLHVSGVRHYTRTMEYSLGNAGGGSMTGLLPGASMNVTSGNVCYQLPLFSGKSSGFSITPTLIYNSMESYPSQFGPGWRFNFEMTVTDHLMAVQTSEEMITLQLGDGRSVVFRYDTTHGYLVADPEFNFPAKFERLGSYGQWIKMTAKSGEQFYFNSTGRLQWIQDLLGNQLTLTYANDTSTGAKVLVNAGIHLVSGGGWDMGITPETGPLSKYRPLTISDPNNNRYDFTYTGNQLTQVKFTSGPGTPTYNFTYGAGNTPATQERLEVLKTVQLPRGQTWSLKYQPDGRFMELNDPSEVYLLDGEADGVTPTAHVAKVLAGYTEPRPATGPRLTTVTDRRNFDTRYTVESRRSLVLGIEDPSVLAATPNIVATQMTYDEFGNVTDIKDRWNQHTTYVYDPDALPDYVHNNLLQTYRPKAGGGGQDLVASYTYTKDNLNNVETQTTYATPTEGASAVARLTQYTYNAMGQVTQIQFPNVQRPDNTPQDNNFQTFAYDGPDRQLSRMTDEEGHETIYSQWNPVNGLAGYIWREGGDQGTTLSYDALGHLIQQLQPQGSPSNDSPLPTTYVLDELYRVKSVSDAGGQITTFTYDVDSNLLSTTPPAGSATTTTYDLRGLVTGGTTPDGNWAQFVDANGNARRTRDPRGIESNVTIDFLGRVNESRTPGASTVTGGSGGGGAATEKTQFAYEQHDTGGYFSLQTVVGATVSRVTKTLYDERHRVKQVNAPDGLTQNQLFYDELDHQIAAQTLYNNVLQSCAVEFLDARDRVYRTRSQDGPYKGTSQNQQNTYRLYNRTGHVVQSVDPQGSVTAGGYAHKTTYVLDARDRVAALIDGKGNIVSQNVYGDDDRVVQVLGPDPSTKSTLLVPLQTMAYTSRKELKAALDSQGNGQRFTYNALPGQVNTVTDALNRVSQTLYESTTQRPTTEIESLGTADESRVLKAWANGFLNQVTVWNPATQAYDASYSYNYDQAGRLEKYSTPAVAQTQQTAPEQYFYNEFGEASKQVAGLKTIAQTYNTLGQATNTAWSGAYSAAISRTYNGLGLQSSVSDGTHNRLLDYDLWRGTPKNETFAVGGANWKVQTHAFDPSGNYTGMTDAEGKAHAWPVDENNRPTEIRYNGQGVKAITYTPAGLVDSETTKDASGNPISSTTHLYDSLGRKTTSRTVKKATGETLTEYGWDYDPAYQISAVHVRHLATDYTIGSDGKGRVASEGTPGNANGTAVPAFTNPAFGPLPTGNESAPTSDTQGIPHTLLPVAARTASYSYQAAGNRKSATINGVTVTYTYNAANQLVSEASTGKSVTHVYDQWGNEKTRTTIQGATTTTETYIYNHLNQMSGYTNSTTGANWQYSFWPEGDRYAKTNLTTGSSELYVPRFGDVATEYTQTGVATPALENTYVQGLGIDTKSTRISSANQRRHYLSNQVGSLGMTLDDLGSTVETSVRDAWGVQIAGTTTERFGGIAQRETDSESGLVYMRHRMYDPLLGRFTQSDPIRSRRAQCHYSYAHNNPLSHKDPRGLYEPVEDANGNEIGRRNADGKVVYYKTPIISAENRSAAAAQADAEKDERLRTWTLAFILGTQMASDKSGSDLLVEEAVILAEEEAVVGSSAGRAPMPQGARPIVIAPTPKPAPSLLAPKSSGSVSPLQGQLVTDVVESSSAEPTWSFASKSVPRIGYRAQVPGLEYHPPAIQTPYGPAEQAQSAEAFAMRNAAEAGAPLYKTGTLGKSFISDAQFWAAESPSNSGYAARYGIPPQNVIKSDFFVTGRLKPGAKFVTRVAPASGGNPGGGIELVTEEGGVQVDTFSSTRKGD